MSALIRTPSTAADKGSDVASLASDVGVDGGTTGPCTRCHKVSGKGTPRCCAHCHRLYCGSCKAKDMKKDGKDWVCKGCKADGLSLKSSKSAVSVDGSVTGEIVCAHCAHASAKGTSRPCQDCAKTYCGKCKHKQMKRLGKGVWQCTTCSKQSVKSENVSLQSSLNGKSLNSTSTTIDLSTADHVHTKDSVEITTTEANATGNGPAVAHVIQDGTNPPADTRADAADVDLVTPSESAIDGLHQSAGDDDPRLSITDESDAASLAQSVTSLESTKRKKKRKGDAIVSRLTYSIRYTYPPTEDGVQRSDTINTDVALGSAATSIESAAPDDSTASEVITYSKEKVKHPKSGKVSRSSSLSSGDLLEEISSQPISQLQAQAQVQSSLPKLHKQLPHAQPQPQGREQHIVQQALPPRQPPAANPTHLKPDSHDATDAYSISSLDEDQGLSPVPVLKRAALASSAATATTASTFATASPTPSPKPAHRSPRISTRSATATGTDRGHSDEPSVDDLYENARRHVRSSSVSEGSRNGGDSSRSQSSFADDADDFDSADDAGFDEGVKAAASQKDRRQSTSLAPQYGQPFSYHSPDPSRSPHTRKPSLSEVHRANAVGSEEEAAAPVSALSFYLPKKTTATLPTHDANSHSPGGRRASLSAADAAQAGSSVHNASAAGWGTVVSEFRRKSLGPSSESADLSLSPMLTRVSSNASPLLSRSNDSRDEVSSSSSPLLRSRSPSISKAHEEKQDGAPAIAGRARSPSVSRGPASAPAAATATERSPMAAHSPTHSRAPDVRQTTPSLSTASHPHHVRSKSDDDGVAVKANVGESSRLSAPTKQTSAAEKAGATLPDSFSGLEEGDGAKSAALVEDLSRVTETRHSSNAPSHRPILAHVGVVAQKPTGPSSVTRSVGVDAPHVATATAADAANSPIRTLHPPAGVGASSGDPATPGSARKSSALSAPVALDAQPHSQQANHTSATGNASRKADAVVAKSHSAPPASTTAPVAPSQAIFAARTWSSTHSAFADEESSDDDGHDGDAAPPVKSAVDTEARGRRQGEPAYTASHSVKEAVAAITAASAASHSGTQHSTERGSKPDNMPVAPPPSSALSLERHAPGPVDAPVAHHVSAHHVRAQQSVPKGTMFLPPNTPNSSAPVLTAPAERRASTASPSPQSRLVEQPTAGAQSVGTHSVTADEAIENRGLTASSRTSGVPAHSAQRSSTMQPTIATQQRPPSSGSSQREDGAAITPADPHPQSRYHTESSERDDGRITSARETDRPHAHNLQHKQGSRDSVAAARSSSVESRARVSWANSDESNDDADADPTAVGRSRSPFERRPTPHFRDEDMSYSSANDDEPNPRVAEAPPKPRDARAPIVPAAAAGRPITHAPSQVAWGAAADMSMGADRPNPRGGRDVAGGADGENTNDGARTGRAARPAVSGRTRDHAAATARAVHGGRPDQRHDVAAASSGAPLRSSLRAASPSAAVLSVAARSRGADSMDTSATPTRNAVSGEGEQRRGRAPERMQPGHGPQRSHATLSQMSPVRARSVERDSQPTRQMHTAPDQQPRATTRQNYAPDMYDATGSSPQRRPLSAQNSRQSLGSPSRDSSVGVTLPTRGRPSAEHIHSAAPSARRNDAEYQGRHPPSAQVQQPQRRRPGEHDARQPAHETIPSRQEPMSRRSRSLSPSTARREMPTSDQYALYSAPRGAGRAGREGAVTTWDDRANRTQSPPPHSRPQQQRGRSPSPPRSTWRPVSVVDRTTYHEPGVFCSRPDCRVCVARRVEHYYTPDVPEIHVGLDRIAYGQLPQARNAARIDRSRLFYLTGSSFIEEVDALRVGDPLADEFAERYVALKAEIDRMRAVAPPIGSGNPTLRTSQRPAERGNLSASTERGGYAPPEHRGRVPSSNSMRSSSSASHLDSWSSDVLRTNNSSPSQSPRGQFLREASQMRSDLHRQQAANSPPRRQTSEHSRDTRRNMSPSLRQPPLSAQRDFADDNAGDIEDDRCGSVEREGQGDVFAYTPSSSAALSSVRVRSGEEGGVPVVYGDVYEDDVIDAAAEYGAMYGGCYGSHDDDDDDDDAVGSANPNNYEAGSHTNK